MFRISIITALMLIVFDCSKKLPLPQIEVSLKKELITYVEHNYMSPENYVLNKLKLHDVVFIGEWHRIKHNVLFIQNLIPKLYENGVFLLGTEFARREDQGLIDSLINGSDYNQELAEKITFLQFVHWGYTEYCDIFKSAWQLNQSLPGKNRKFRILGLNSSPDWSIMKTTKDRSVDSLKRKVWRGGGDKFMAKVIMDEAVSKGEKIVVYSGMHHAFSEYKQPICDSRTNKFIRFETTRMGNCVYNEIGKRAVTLSLHGSWYSEKGLNKPYVYPADGYIDAIMKELPVNRRSIGFDTKETPFGKLTGNTSFYKYGYENFNLSMFCDGYIFFKSFPEFEGVTPIEGFINESNISYARAQSPNPSFRDAPILKFSYAIKKDANIKKRIAHLR